MKRFYLFVLPIVALAALTACDDDDLPPVGLQLEITGVENVDGNLYAVKGETLVINSLQLVDNTDKGAVISQVTYYIDNLPIGSSIVNPFAYFIETDNMSVGTHMLRATASVYAVDYSPCYATIGYPLTIVESASDFPEDGSSDGSTDGTVVLNATVSPQQ